MSVDFYWNNR